MRVFRFNGERERIRLHDRDTFLTFEESRWPKCVVCLVIAAGLFCIWLIGPVYGQIEALAIATLLAGFALVSRRVVIEEKARSISIQDLISPFVVLRRDLGVGDVASLEIREYRATRRLAHSLIVHPIAGRRRYLKTVSLSGTRHYRLYDQHYELIQLKERLEPLLAVTGK